MPKHELTHCCGTTCDKQANLNYVNELEAVVASIPDREREAIFAAVEYARELPDAHLAGALLEAMELYAIQFNSIKTWGDL